MYMYIDVYCNVTWDMPTGELVTKESKKNNILN